MINDGVTVNKVVDYTDKDGRKYKVLIPANAAQSMAKHGVRIGPPPLDELGYPDKIITKIHNELFDRGIITYKDVTDNMRDVVGAIQHAFAADAQTIATLYFKYEGGKIDAS